MPSLFLAQPNLREMMNYFEDYTYFGPDADRKLALARELYPRRVHILCRLGLPKYDSLTMGASGLVPCAIVS